MCHVLDQVIRLLLCASFLGAVAILALGVMFIHPREW